jgi:hypothetical protein
MPSQVVGHTKHFTMSSKLQKTTAAVATHALPGFLGDATDMTSRTLDSFAAHTKVAICSISEAA